MTTINYLSKLLVGIYAFNTDARKRPVSGAWIFLAKMQLCLIPALWCIILLGRSGNHLLPDSKIGSFVFLMLIYPFVSYAAADRSALLAYLDQTDDAVLKRHYRHFLIILIGNCVLFMVAAILMNS
ncbi:hypothetical protein [Flavilitoribacter nigricans]|uniref:Uncharacterized protein n=1 Tax=Flavilitoribacter nigricans (strain ATCC 23147 / DSM 23189 / NBRC 102662 / NCIMB 1420 / SS-2) TaxID=1122177 RepID=A0A2D0NCX4_FLAN2|nr:hypothetical protein [Flavilitoribacter nigricans]PHN06248.1 hypothetical protein CRP01_11770 [Flavilitoribacter nigricans DSM 23189 = NBRC 102662]